MALTVEQKIKIGEIITLALQLYQEFDDEPTKTVLGHVVSKLGELIA